MTKASLYIDLADRTIWSMNTMSATSHNPVTLQSDWKPNPRVAYKKKKVGDELAALRQEPHVPMCVAVRRGVEQRLHPQECQHLPRVRSSVAATAPEAVFR